jgi:hypothetical protein
MGSGVVAESVGLLGSRFLWSPAPLPTDTRASFWGGACSLIGATAVPFAKCL